MMPQRAEVSDNAARRRILEDLESNLLVEAGAGSGKTTSLVGRMVALVMRGTPVESVAAVTFTRKAANELRERFQMELELKVRESTDSGIRERCDRALRDSDRAFLGTIHAFCGRLLRERPLEIGLDPNFEEVTDGDWDELVSGFWRRWLEERNRGGDAAVTELAALGIDARSLAPAFREVVMYPEVHFPLDATPRPDHRSCRRKLEQLLEEARLLMPRKEPEDGWDELMRGVRRLEYHRATCDWSDIAQFCEAVGRIGGCGVTQKRWAGDREGKAAAKALSESFEELCSSDIAELLRAWYEYRYPAVMTFLRRAAADFERERHETGQLGFEDLLMLAAKLLREHPRVRDELGLRYRHLLVDEFQDTDPIQAEVCLLLASESSEGDDWRRVRPRSGSLFVVGDPKQSIYRFRRADIQIYNLVSERFADFGDVLTLTTNFRSVHGIAAFVNGHFDGPFPHEATAQQAAFRKMEPRHADSCAAVRYYDYTIPRGPDSLLFEADARIVADVIADRIAGDGRDAGDFLVLTTRKDEIAYYARALGRRNIPVTTTGAKLPQEYELRELLTVLHCLADPENPVMVAAALEGMFFGLSPAALYAGRRSGLHLSITHRPTGGECAVERALLQLHRWWIESQRHAADVVVERIFQDTGMLFAAASESLGDARAGALMHLVEVLRASSIVGSSGVVAAMERIDVLLKSEAPDAQLRPGRSDAVRVMNLHKAKGLEATVVFLAAPRKDKEHEPKAHISRGTGGAPTGWLKLCGEGGEVIAQPRGWSEHVATEKAFDRGEDDRLLYVAATRAKEELIVSRCTVELSSGPKPVESAWRAFDAALAAHGTPLVPPTSLPGERAECTRPVADVLEAIAEADHRRTVARETSFAIATVSESAKAELETARAYDLPHGRGLGAAWGRATHRVIEAMGRGRAGGSLASFIDAVARDEQLPADRAERLHDLATRVVASAAWQRLITSGAPAFELGIMHCATGADGVAVVRQGVIDAAVQEPEGWQVIDWKSDDVSGAQWADRLDRYLEQVGAYASMLQEVSGRPAAGVIERVTLP
jgi:ATP-dependent helicase/nuclease subunit A